MIIREDLLQYRIFRIQNYFLCRLNSCVRSNFGDSGCYFLLKLLVAMAFLVTIVFGIFVYFLAFTAPQFIFMMTILYMIVFYSLTLLMLAVIPESA
jgi:hypothetical protein